MGNRGRLAVLKLSPAERLASLDPPGWLGETASAFWTDHARHLAADGLLNRHTVDSFSLVCDLWERYRLEARPAFAVQLGKQYIAAAKLFRLLPGDKETLGQPEVRHSEKQELDFA